jgi:RNA polymerase sigma-70 factor (ECF subfamily)
VADDAAFADLMARLKAGDPDAARGVFDRFARRLIGLARSRLPARLRQKVDPEDLAQSVFKSLFLGHADGRFDLDSWDSLWALLTRITVRKCCRAAERFQAGKRDLNAEAGPPAADELSSDCQALAREPTPSEAAMLTETIEHLLRGLEGRDRDIVTLSLQGYTGPEISAQLGRPERTVYRVLGRVRKRLEQMQAEDAE